MQLNKVARDIMISQAIQWKVIKREVINNGIMGLETIEFVWHCVRTIGRIVFAFHKLSLKRKAISSHYERAAVDERRPL